MAPQDVLHTLHAGDLGALENTLQHIHPDRVFDDSDLTDGAPLSIAAIDRMHPGDLSLLGAILNAGADPNLEWPDLGPERSGYTPLVHAIYHGHASAISALLRAGADPHRLILASPDPDWGVGFTPAMHLLGMPWLSAQVQGSPDPRWEDPTGRWELTVYDYHASDWPRSTCWGEEPSYAWIDVHPDGTFVFEEWMGGQERGEWLCQERVLLFGDDARALRLSHGGHAASIDYTDEETGGRGDATFWYVRAEVTQGHPLRPA